jgi:hypothetical protein
MFYANNIFVRKQQYLCIISELANQLYRRTTISRSLLYGRVRRACINSSTNKEIILVKLMKISSENSYAYVCFHKDSRTIGLLELIVLVGQVIIEFSRC